MLIPIAVAISAAAIGFSGSIMPLYLKVVHLSVHSR